MAQGKFLRKPDMGAVQPGPRAWSENRSTFSWRSVETSYLHTMTQTPSGKWCCVQHFPFGSGIFLLLVQSTFSENHL